MSRPFGYRVGVAAAIALSVGLCPAVAEADDSTATGPSNTAADSSSAPDSQNGSQSANPSTDLQAPPADESSTDTTGQDSATSSSGPTNSTSGPASKVGFTPTDQVATHVGVDSATNTMDQPATTDATGVPAGADLADQPATAGAAPGADTLDQPATGTTPPQPDTASAAATAASDNDPSVGPTPRTADMAIRAARTWVDYSYGPCCDPEGQMTWNIVSVDKLSPDVTITAYDAEEGWQLWPPPIGYAQGDRAGRYCFHNNPWTCYQIRRNPPRRNHEHHDLGARRLTTGQPPVGPAVPGIDADSASRHRDIRMDGGGHRGSLR